MMMFTDLCLDVEDDTSDEVRPNPIQFLDPRARDVSSLRYTAVSKQRHLCLELDGMYTEIYKSC